MFEQAPADSRSASARLRVACDREAGTDLIHDLEAIDITELSADEAITYLQQVQRAAAWFAGFEAWSRRLAAARVLAHHQEPGRRSESVTPERAASAEIAAALRMSAQTADSRIQDSADLTGPWIMLLDALDAGELSPSHMHAITRELRRMPAYGDEGRQVAYSAQCNMILKVVIPFGRTHTPAQCGRKVRRLASVVDPAGRCSQRRLAAELDHTVFLRPGSEPDTCELTAILPLAPAQAIYHAINTLAHDDRLEVGNECVTMGQRRVTALIALTLGEPGTVTTLDGPVPEVKLRAHIDVVVPLATMVALAASGLTTAFLDQPAGTVGAEAVSSDVLADLIAQCDPSSTLRRMVTDCNGSVLDLGRTRYAISDAQRHLVTRRDSTCRFPGCRRAAARCEVDHALAWKDGGATDIDNLGALCKYHHQLKTHTNWEITSSARDGSCTWRSPLGRVYHSSPPDPLPVGSEFPPTTDSGPPF